MIIASAQHAPDDLVFFLDADDIWADDHLAIVSAALGGPLAACDFVFTDKRDAEQAAPFRAGAMLAGECHVLGTTSLLHPRTLSSPIGGTRILSQDLAQDLGRGSFDAAALLIRHLLDVCRSIRIDRSQSVDMVCYTRTDGTRIQWPTNLRLVCGA